MRLIHKRGRERLSFPLDEGETYIGRKDYCEIFFPDGSLSKRHARLVRRGRRLVLFDAGSRNGTFLNGETVEDEEPLANGDVIQCGKLRFKVDGIPEGSEHDDYVVSGDGRSRHRSTKSQQRRRTSESDLGPSRSRPNEALISARAVASTEARPSMLDVLPELPASVEDQEGVGEDAEGARKAGALLRLVEGGPEQTWYLEGEDVVTIGSKDENAVVLSGEGVSRYHANLVSEEGNWVLKDLGARNGIFIAGERLEDDRVLKPGDEFQIGTVKLRFEVITPSPFEGVLAAWDGFRRDPKKAFQEDPRVRLGLAGILFSLILAVMALPGAAPGFNGVSDRGSHGPWLQEGSAGLVSGDYKGARDVFRRAKVKVAAHAQDVPSLLEQIAKQWIDLAAKDADPFAFRWRKAGDLLVKSAKLKGLPDELRSWLQEQTQMVDLNTEAFETYTRAKALATTAREAARKKNQMENALETYSKALLEFDKVSPSSMFSAAADAESGQAGQEAFKALIRDLKKRMRSPNPNWAATVNLILNAQDFARIPSERQELRRLAEECEINRRDEELYVQATKLINQRILAKYPEAQRLLGQVDRRSRIYPDAQAYIDWIDADLKVRQAKRSYDIADSRQAFQLLNEALRYEVLGPEARNSVLSRRHHWARVVRAYERGMQHFHEGNTRDAKEEFERVRSLEPNPRNRFHVRARDQISHMIQSEALGLEHKLREGMRALKSGDYAAALKWFAEARADPNHRDRDLQKIRFAVDAKAKSARLLSRAKDNLLHDRTETFVDIRDVFKLLTLWLPEGHKDRKEARKHLQTVVGRLKNWRSGRAGRPR